MNDQKKCTLCKTVFDGEDAAVLTMSGFGNARYICPECESLLDKATLGENCADIKGAISQLSDRVTIDPQDAVAFEAYTEILNGAAKRAEKIKSGEYDFSLDAEASDFEEIPEELRETEEDRALDEKEAKANAIMDKISSWVCGAIIAGVVVYFIIRMIL